MTGPADLPAWLRPLVDSAESIRPERPGSAALAEDGARPAAVLVLLGDYPPATDSPPGDVLLIERAHGMRRHAGQMAFPGGAIESHEDAVAAALREAEEETALDIDGVAVLATLPVLHLPQRQPGGGPGFDVTPVLAWWRAPCEVQVADPAEVASVHRVPLERLIDPANRLRVRHPSGYVGPAFRLGELLVWGFTAALLDRLLAVAGWEKPWDTGAAQDLPPYLLRLTS